MDRYYKFYYIGVCCLLVAGCTELKVTPLTLASATPATGVSYSLPFTQYDITLTRELTACDAQTATIVPTVSATALTRPDPDATYTIDYTKLSSAWKISDLQLALFPNGMIQQLSASAEDRTGPILVNVATGIAQLAIDAATLGVGVPGSFKSGRARQVPASTAHCTPDTLKALQQVGTAKRRLDKASAAAITSSARIKALAGAITALGGKIDSPAQRLLFTATEDDTRKQAALAVAASDLADARDKLTDVRTFRWPARSDERDGPTQDIDSKTLTKWFGTSAPQLKDASGNSLDFNVTVALRATSRLAVPPPPPASNSGVAPSELSGLRYRVPVMGHLVACKGNKCEVGSLAIKSVAESPIPQLGRIFLLPFSNGPFENNVLKATFADDGTLVSAGYTEKAATAEGASDTFAKLASNLGGNIKDYRAAQNASSDARAAALKSRTGALVAQADYDTAVAALGQGEDTARKTKLLQTDTLYQKALLENLQAQQALQQARSAPAPGSP